MALHCIGRAGGLALLGVGRLPEDPISFLGLRRVHVTFDGVLVFDSIRRAQVAWLHVLAHACARTSAFARGVLSQVQRFL